MDGAAHCNASSKEKSHSGFETTHFMICAVMFMVHACRIPPQPHNNNKSNYSIVQQSVLIYLGVCGRHKNGLHFESPGSVQLHQHFHSAVGTDNFHRWRVTGESCYQFGGVFTDRPNKTICSCIVTGIADITCTACRTKVVRATARTHRCSF